MNLFEIIFQVTVRDRDSGETWPMTLGFSLSAPDRETAGEIFATAMAHNIIAELARLKALREGEAH